MFRAKGWRKYPPDSSICPTNGHEPISGTKHFKTRLPNGASFFVGPESRALPAKHVARGSPSRKPWESATGRTSGQWAATARKPPRRSSQTVHDDESGKRNRQPPGTEQRAARRSARSCKGIPGYTRGRKPALYEKSPACG